jgi:ubiquinone/menaquinone biosynthesis C-methylase UbiE
MLNEVYVSNKLREVKEFEEGLDERLRKLDKVVEERIGKFKVMDFVPKGIVADFGTGIGTDLISLSKLCDDVELVGVDITSKGLKVARDLLSKEEKEFHLIRADALFPPFRDEVFDDVNFSNVLHHHPFSLLERMLKEVDRISRRNSQILIAEPSYLNESYEFSMEIDRISDGARDLEKLSSVYNLKDLKKTEYGLHVFGYYGNIYPSMLKRVLKNYGFKITKTRVVAESGGTDEATDKLKGDINSLSLDESAKEYLIERLEDLEKKYSMVNPICEFTLYMKAVRGSSDRRPQVNSDDPLDSGRLSRRDRQPFH